jgi:hypothetical protein
LFGLGVFDEKFGDFSFFKDKEFYDEAVFSKFFVDHIVGDFDDEGIVDANEEDF